MVTPRRLAAALEAYLLEEPFGLIFIDALGRVIDKVILGDNPADAASSIARLRAGEVSAEILDAVNRLRARGYDTVVLENEALAKAIGDKVASTLRISKLPATADEFKERLFSLSEARKEWLVEQGLDLPFLATGEAYRGFAQAVALHISRMTVKLAAAKRDIYAIQGIRAIDDLDKTLNLYAGRIREWYGLHFPELDRLVEKHETYLRLIVELGNRRNFTHENLERLGLPREKCVAIAEAKDRSMGAEIEEEELAWIKSLSETTLGLYELRARLEGYVEEAMKEASPNLVALVGPTIAARLLSISGGLENLAKMPSSTIQVLGAEKALFRALKTGARPPKHGIIFQHPYIHQAPRWLRGKIARALAGKLSIAARIDAFGGEFMGESLREDFEEKVKEIKEKYKAPPPRRVRLGKRKAP